MIKKIMIDNNYDYDCIFNHKKTIVNVSNSESDMNFIIGVKGRLPYFRATIQNLIMGVKSTTKLKVNIIVVEQDIEPINQNFCIENNVGYIFIPLEITKSDNLHSTSLMYNIGYLFSKTAKYSAFHCADIMVGHHFFETLSDYYFNKDFNWLQPYCDKRVVTFSPSTTNSLLNGVFPTFDPSKFDSEMFNSEPEVQGAPGGCVIVPSELFENVGGYDPELFYGYTVEDSFFWCKLEVMVNGEKCPHIHFKGGTYAENPKLYLYHLHHPNIKNENPYFKKMFDYYSEFCSIFTYEQQLEYIKHKSEIFKQQKEKLRITKLKMVT